MARTWIKPADVTWLFNERRDHPMHVATLLIYSLPSGAPPDYLRQLLAKLRDSSELAEPFNRRLAYPGMLALVPLWDEVFDLDVEYHVRHLALPSPGGERELGALIARLHSNPMDMNRPLWEYHIIEGLEHGRFAIYFKMHHSLVDGVAGIRMLQRSMSTSAGDTSAPSLWSAQAPADAEPAAGSRAAPLEAVRAALESAGSFVKGLADAARAANDDRDPLTLPFQTPVSILNHRIRGQRRFATQQYDFARIRRLAKAADCTINDIVLALSSGALRRFLKELSALPGRSLTAGVPVSLRTKEDQGAGAAVSFIIVSLGTNIADPLRRLESIKASSRRAKALMQGMDRGTVERFTAAIMAPYTLQVLSGLEGRTRPVFNLVISNVPGPTEYLYLHGSRLEAMYPVSNVTHGQALNITCYSYAGKLSFGFSGCRDTVPHLQRVAVYTGEALEELEQVLLAPKQEAEAKETPSPKPVPPRARKATRKPSTPRTAARKPPATHPATRKPAARRKHAAARRKR